MKKKKIQKSQVGRKPKYEGKTIVVSFRIPKNSKNEISQTIKEYIKAYEISNQNSKEDGFARKAED